MIVSHSESIGSGNICTLYWWRNFASSVDFFKRYQIVFICHDSIVSLRLLSNEHKKFLVRAVCSNIYREQLYVWTSVNIF